MRNAWYRSRLYNAWLQHCPLCVVWPTHDVAAAIRGRSRRLRRRRAARYCLWGHYGHLVQIGSQTDRYLQRRLKRDARRRAFDRAARVTRTTLITLSVSTLQMATARTPMSAQAKPLILP